MQTWTIIIEQKKRLEEEKKKILHQINKLKKEDPFADPDHVTDNAAVDTDVREQLGHEAIEAQIKDVERRLNDIDLTISRINKGRYGYCEKCSEAIPLARLKLIPEARYCIPCERKLRK